VGMLLATDFREAEFLQIFVRTPTTPVRYLSCHKICLTRRHVSFELSYPSPPALANFPLEEEEEKVVANHGTPSTSGSTSSCHIEDRGTTWLQETCRTRTSQILCQETVDIRYFRFTLPDTLMCFLRTPNFVHE